MKIRLLCVCTVLFCQVATSQVQFGLKGGMNVANAVKIEGDPSLRLAGYLGGKMWLSIGGNFSFAPELLFTGKGYIYHQVGADDDNSPIRLSYIAAPILFDYLLDTKTHFILGAEIEYLLSAKMIYGSKRKDAKFLFTPDFDLGLCAGLDHQFLKSLHVEFRYVHGITKIYRPYTPDFSDELYEMEGYNRVLQIGLIYKFH